MTTLDNLVVTTALPVIHKDLHASLSGLEWTVNAYTLTFAVLLLTGAALGDRFGRRRMFVIGLSIYGQFAQAFALRYLSAGTTGLVSSYGTLVVGVIGAVMLLHEQIAASGYVAGALLAIALALGLVPVGRGKGQAASESF